MRIRFLIFSFTRLDVTGLKQYNNFYKFPVGVKFFTAVTNATNEIGGSVV
jgi:hypothetical protein